MAGGDFPEAHTVSPEDRARIDAWVTDLIESKVGGKKEATQGLRLLTRKSSMNRDYVALIGAIPTLVSVLLETDDAETRKHAVTTLLNLSINAHLKDSIVSAGAVDPIVEVLRTGDMEARENAAAALFSLSTRSSNKALIGNTEGAIPGLVQLLIDGSKRGKRDAASALFDLSIYHDNKALAVRAGVIPPLMKLLVDENEGIAEEALVVLAILATHTDGQTAIGHGSTAVPIFVDIITDGNPRQKENAAAILLELCSNDPNHIYASEKYGVYGPLGELASTGTAKARRKAKKLLDLHKRVQHLVGTSYGSRSI